MLNDYFKQRLMGFHVKSALEHNDMVNIIGTFCFGSQNYNLATENSDLDTKTLVTPSITSIASNHSIHGLVSYDNNSKDQATMTDVRVAMTNFVKSGIPDLEILFTNYYWVNPLYTRYYNQLREWREAIAYCKPTTVLFTTQSIAKKEAAKALESDKMLCEVLRREKFLELYCKGEGNFAEALSSGAEFLDIKLGNYDKSHVKAMVAASLRHIDDLVEKNKGMKRTVFYTQTSELLYDVRLSIIKTSLEEELAHEHPW